MADSSEAIGVSLRATSCRADVGAPDVAGDGPVDGAVVVEASDHGPAEDAMGDRPPLHPAASRAIAPPSASPMHHLPRPVMEPSIGSMFPARAAGVEVPPRQATTGTALRRRGRTTRPSATRVIAKSPNPTPAAIFHGVAEADGSGRNVTAEAGGSAVCV